MILTAALRWFARAIVAVIAIAILSWPFFWPREDARGIWVTEGYGMVLDVGRFRIDGYQVNAAGCVPVIAAPAHSLLLSETADAVLRAQDGRLIITVEGTVNPIMGEPIDALPDTCTTAPDASPQAVFDIAYAAMDEHYAFFDLHGVNWADRYVQLPTDADDAALWAAITGALSGLDDGHTYLFNPATQDMFSPAANLDWADDLPVLRETLRARDLTIIQDTGLEYAVLPGNIGYVFLRHMGTNPGLFTTEADVAFSAFVEISDAFANTDAIILDNRLNPGGSDTVALAYATFFASEPTTAFTKTTRTATGHTAPVEGTVAPIGTLTQPVYLLNSSYTASAAEIFTMALQDLPQVTVIGEPTSGGLSDILEWTLPNGWLLGLSHQVYLDASGTLHEGTGIPPDETEPFVFDALANGEDPQLDALIERLR